MLDRTFITAELGCSLRGEPRISVRNHAQICGSGNAWNLSVHKIKTRGIADAGGTCSADATHVYLRRNPSFYENHCWQEFLMAVSGASRISDIAGVEELLAEMCESDLWCLEPMSTSATWISSTCPRRRYGTKRWGCESESCPLEYPVCVLELAGPPETKAEGAQFLNVSSCRKGHTEAGRDTASQVGRSRGVSGRPTPSLKRQVSVLRTLRRSARSAQ